MTAGGGSAAVGRAAGLVSLFVSPPDAFGRLAPVTADLVPEPFRTLLDHRSHMTGAMERHHGGPVTLDVVAVTFAGGRYAREILLTGPGGRVVQFGIVRMDLGAVDESTAARISAAGEPLGRILPEAGVLCDVGDVGLLAIDPGPHLRSLIGPRATFGRVATIALDGRPAVELLEVVAAE